MQWVVHKCLTCSVDLKRAEPPLKATSARDDRQHRETGVFFFFYSEGIVHHEYAPDGQTINKGFYLEVLRRLRESVRRKRPGKMAGWRLDPVPRQCAPRTLHILCSSFWPNTVPFSCSSRHTQQISHRVSFSYSQGLRKFWKDTDLRQRRTWNKIRRTHYQTSWKRSSRNVSNSGRNVGRSV